MSYFRPFPVRTRPAKTPMRLRPPLGDALEDLYRQAAADENATCDRAGNDAQAPYDQMLADMRSTWGNRDGFFYLADARAIVGKGLELQRQGQALLDQVRAKYGDSISSAMKSGRDQAQKEIFALGDTAAAFLNAINAAQARGATVLDAPGLRDWTISCISAASGAAYIGAYFSCHLVNVGAFLGPLQVLLAAGNGVVAAVKAAAVVAAKVGEVVYKTTVGTLDFVATVAKYGPMIAAGLGGLWLFKRLKEQGRI